MAQSFQSRAELHSIVVTDKPSVEAWHTVISGFGARIMRKNSRTGKTLRTYIARFKDSDGKDQKVPVGTFDEIGYDEAMRRAQDMVAAASHERKTGKKPLPTLGAALDLYLLERDSKLRPSTVHDYQKRWAYLSKWHDQNVVLLNSDWWGERYLELMKFGRPTADGVLRVAHAVYQSLVDDEKLTLNPVKRQARKHEIFAHSQPRQSLITTDELPVVWSWLETRAHVCVRDCVRFALFSGLRDSVVGSMRWENINIEKRLMLVPAEERGNKGGRLVWVPFSDWLFDNVIYARWQNRIGSNPWVFPSPKKAGHPLTDIRGSMKTLKEETGIHINPHKLRRTFGTIGNQATGNQLMVARMLTHSHKAVRFDDAPAVTAGYVVTAEVELRKAFNAVADLLIEMTKPKPELQLAA